MTLQIALVGTDGIVLASDRKYAMTTTCRHTFVATKIRIDRERGIALTYAGNDLGIIATKAILTDFRDEDYAYSPQLPLERIGEKVFKEVAAGRQYPSDQGDVLMVMLRDLSHVHHLTVCPKGICYSAEDKAVAGHNANAGLFFAERYYQKLPINDLAFVAAHTVLMGAEVHPSGISGLEMVFCRPEGFTLVPVEQIAEYTNRSKQLDEKIKQALIPQLENPRAAD